MVEELTLKEKQMDEWKHGIYSKYEAVIENKFKQIEKSEDEFQ